MKTNAQLDSSNTVLNEAVFRPMLFSITMVKALLNGSKTQTRRLVNPQPIIDIESGYVFDGKHKSMYKNDPFHPDWKTIFINDHSKIKEEEIIWVRETFSPIFENDFVYKADDDFYNDNIENWQGWKPSMFMPKSACRIWNKVSSVRIERLQDITESDAIYEGIICEWVELTTMTFATMDYMTGKMRFDFTARDSYKSLWVKINGQKSWDENPFVWVYNLNVSTNRPHGFI